MIISWVTSSTDQSKDNYFKFSKDLLVNQKEARDGVQISDSDLAEDKSALELSIAEDLSEEKHVIVGAKGPNDADIWLKCLSGIHFFQSKLLADTLLDQ